MRNAAMEAVLAAEERGRLFEQRVLGYPVWPLERLRRYRLELLKGELIESTGPRAPLKARLNAMKAPLLQSLRDARELTLPKALGKRDIWVLGTTNYRRKDANGVLQCIYAEDLRRQLGDRLLFLERTTNDLSVPPREDVFHLDALHVSAMLSAKALGPVLAATGAITAAQKQAFAPMSPSYVCQLAMYGQTMQRIAAGLIAQHPPAAVFVLCAYQPFIPIQRAVRAAGIPLIELQHGIIHESHPGYVLGEGSTCDHVPDHLVVFGPRFARIASHASPYWEHRMSIGGHAWLREQSQGVSPASERDAIVLFGQADGPVREALRAIAIDLAAKKGELGARARIIVKPHPRETDGYYDDLRERGVEIAPFGSDSYALLRECRVSVGVHSTVVIEAPAFGCTSAVTLPSMWTDEIRAMAEAGSLLRVDGADDVIAAFLACAPGASQSSARLADDLFAVNQPPLDYPDLLHSFSRTR